jgi:hypothetical protein
VLHRRNCTSAVCQPRTLPRDRIVPAEGLRSHNVPQKVLARLIEIVAAAQPGHTPRIAFDAGARVRTRRLHVPLDVHRRRALLQPPAGSVAPQALARFPYVRPKCLKVRKHRLKPWLRRHAGLPEWLRANAGGG